MQHQADQDRDVQALERLAAGDRQALADVYDAHGVALFRHALALCGSTADAEDLVQATFLKLATMGARLLGVRRPAGYLHEMLRASWIDIVRRRAISREDPAADQVSDPSADPTGTANDALDLARALAALPVSQREIVTLHLVNGLSFREVGRVTQVSMFTAASRYRLALGRLRNLLGER